MQCRQDAVYCSLRAARRFLLPANRHSNFLVALLLIAAGCHRGPELAPVKGRVTLNDKPLTGAEVRFEPPIGRASHGTTNESGDYELRYSREEMGAIVGSQTVRILSATEVTLPDGRFVIRPQLVPEQYNTESELQREVESGTDNVFNFDLKGKRKGAGNAGKAAG